MSYNLNDRKWVFAFVSLILLAGLLLPNRTAVAAEGERGIVIAEKLNLRAESTLDSRILKVLDRGQSLELLSRSGDGNWSEVRLPDGLQGWVYSLYIQVSTSSEAIVSVERLNLRAGPGFLSHVIKVLDLGQEVHLEGRSEYSDWLQVTLPNGLGGWIYRAFVETDADIASLPLKEASGGPTTDSSDPKPSYSILVTIWDNGAEVDLAGFPADQRFTIYLGLPGKEADLAVAKGRTNTDGRVVVAFEMPATWSNDEEITEEKLAVTVAAEDGSFTRHLNIQYYRW